MMTILIALCLTAGFLCGHFLPALAGVQPDSVVTILLYVMLFLVGIDLGSKDGLRSAVKKLGLDAVALPALVAVGSVAGGLLAGLALKMKLWQGAAVGAGFGWYSLSSVILGKIDPALGAVAFLTNILREIIALLLIPLFCRFIHPWAGMAAGGATAMDTTLPVVVKASGGEYAIQSFVSGVILSILVPIAISAILAIAGV